MAIGTFSLSACTPRKEPVLERSFSTVELLISLSDMPPGWTGGIGKKLEERADYFSTEDSASISFGTDTELPYKSAGQRIYRYDNPSVAKSVLEELILPGEVGETPSDWTYQSPVADQFFFACYDYEGRTQPRCRWSGLYDEYIVIFGSWMIPGRMSLNDMEKVIRAIDARMAEFLNSR